MKHHGLLSRPRPQPGSGAQGASLGNQEFLSQTNENADSVPEKERFKFVDDLTALETINLLNIGLCSYNFKQHKATVPEGGYFIDSKNLDSQMYLDKINQWTVNQKMQLNKNKTKAMIINYTNKYQFNTRLQLDKSNIVLVNSMKILGTIIKYDLTWDDNTNNIIRKVNKRMLLLKKIHSFGASPEDMVQLWKIYCRSVLEQSSVVWYSSLTQQNKNDLERTQKIFAKLVMKNKYNNYNSVLETNNLESLEDRRQELALRLAKNCTKNLKFQNLFLKKLPIRPSRNPAKYQLSPCLTERAPFNRTTSSSLD